MRDLIWEHGLAQNAVPSPSDALFRRDITERLRDRFAERMNQPELQQQLLLRKSILRYLYAWRDMSSVETVKQWVREMASTDEGLFDLLIRLQTSVFSSDKGAYLSHVILVCVASASIYVFNSFAPLVALRYAEIDPQQFGALNFITSVGLFIGAVIVRRLSHKHAGERFLRIGMGLIVTAGLVMAGLFEHSMITVFTIFIPAFALFVGIALVLPNASMMALTGADNSALSAGLLSFLSLLTGATAVFISGAYIGEHALALPLTLIITAALGMLGSRMTKGVT